MLQRLRIVIVLRIPRVQPRSQRGSKIAARASSQTEARDTSPTRGTAMLSARNQLVGVVKSVKLGGIMAEVVIQVGQLEIVSVITRSSAESMGLKAGDQVRAVIKSTEVLVDKP